MPDLDNRGRMLLGCFRTFDLRIYTVTNALGVLPFTFNDLLDGTYTLRMYADTDNDQVLDAGEIAVSYGATITIPHAASAYYIVDYGSN